MFAVQYITGAVLIRKPGLVAGIEDGVARASRVCRGGGAGVRVRAAVAHDGILEHGRRVVDRYRLLADVVAARCTGLRRLAQLQTDVSGRNGQTGRKNLRNEEEKAQRLGTHY